MTNLGILATFLHYSESANERLMAAAKSLNDAQLDRPFEMGVGSLRRTLLHLYNGEYVWLQRWQGRTETPWPDEEEKAAVATIAQRFLRNNADRAVFLETVREADLRRPMVYRDSKGSLFSTTLGDMLVQGIAHSIHHRAQAANMLRHVGAGTVELDYMVSVRKPA